MTKQSLAVVIALSLGLSGCSNMLYSNNPAPVYSAPSAKSRTSAENTVATQPPSLNSSSVSTPSIERPVSQASTVQSNPYGQAQSVPQRPSSMTNTAASGVYSKPAPQVVAQPANQTAAVSHPVNQAGVVTASAAPSAVAKPVNNNPRIREANEVLNQQPQVDSPTTARPVNNTVSRPAAVMKQPVATAQPQATASQVATTSAVATQTAAVAKPAVKQPVVVATPVKPTMPNPATVAAPVKSTPAATAVAKPKPATPQSATKSLLKEARDNVAAGNYDKAASALERAHRIEPGNAKILYDIAQIRYAQGKYRQSESFASKAANYSKSSGLSKKIWRLLSNSRKALGNSSGAEAAARKAATF